MGRRDLRRRLVTAMLAVTLLALVLLLGAAATTHYESQRLEVITGPHPVNPPAWSRPCWRRNGDGPAWYTLPCGRVRGRVVYAQKVDPDGDSDAHFVVIAGFRVLVVKLRHAAQHGGLPSIGEHITAVGVVQNGDLGMHTIDVRANPQEWHVRPTDRRAQRLH